VKRFAPLVPLVLLFADPVSALAEVKGPGEDTPLNLPPVDEPARELGTGAGAGGGSLARTFIGLLIVVAVIYGLYYVLRQVKKSREEQAKGTGLHTEAVVPLGPNRALHLVRAGRELVLVGVAEQGVVPIRTYSEEEAITLGLVSDEEDEPSGSVQPPQPPLVAIAERARHAVEGLRARTVRG
jgi:flagellar protein FliO/FliZ